MRHQHELIRRLAMLLRSRMTTAGHLAQVNLTSEHRGNCLPPSRGCSPACLEARALIAATAPFMSTERPAPRPLRPLHRVVLKRPPPPLAQMPLPEAP